jgi:hypothetical protein
MNINDPGHPWARLVKAARSSPDAGESGAPYGFAPRIAARAMSGERVLGSLIERFAFRAVGIAGLLALASVVANLSAFTTHEYLDEENYPTEEPALMLLGD